MLVLSRKKQQSIRIGEHVTLVVVEVRGDHVRLGIEAPRDVAVHRQEVYERLRAQASAEAARQQPGKEVA